MLRKIAHFSLSPNNLFVLFIICLLLVPNAGWIRWGWIGLVVALFVIYVSPLAYALIEPLEDEVPQFDVDHIRQYPRVHVVVLGAGYTNDPDISKTSQLNGTVAVRLIEALTIYHAHPHAIQLITSGARLERTRSQAEAVADAAVSLGVDPADTAYLGNTIHTEHEARMYVKHFGTEMPTVVVSSARHARRALFWFQQAGVKTLYFAPCDYIYKQDPDRPQFRWKPSLSKGTIIKKYLHEWVGLVYAKVKTRGLVRWF